MFLRIKIRNYIYMYCNNYISINIGIYKDIYIITYKHI